VFVESNISGQGRKLQEKNRRENGSSGKIDLTINKLKSGDVKMDAIHGHHYSDLTLEVPLLNARLHFMSFETRHIKDCKSFLKHSLNTDAGVGLKSSASRIHSPNLKSKKNPLSIPATGGGSFKFFNAFLMMDLR